MKIQLRKKIKIHYLADEVIKLKKLKDEGILTEEEFNIQKGKILNR